MNLFSNLKDWSAGIFTDEKGVPSSKRLVGVLCATTLCVTMYHNSFSTLDIAPAPYLVDAVALLAFGCLGLSSVDKFVAAKDSIKSATKSDAPLPTPTQSASSSNTVAAEDMGTCNNCGSEPCVC